MGGREGARCRGWYLQVVAELVYEVYRGAELALGVLQAACQGGHLCTLTGKVLLKLSVGETLLEGGSEGKEEV